MVEICSYCLFDLHFQCQEPDDASLLCCCRNRSELSIDPAETSDRFGMAEISNQRVLPTGLVVYNSDEKPVKRGRPPKDGEDMLDQTSTGRKRAVEIYPIKDGELCGWKGLRSAGGGVIPIIGCFGNDAKHVHHGPDKSTLNNAIGTNLHHVCNNCHNRWHTLNDEFYGVRPDGGEPFVPVGSDCTPHNAESKATNELITMHEVWWKTPIKKRPPYPGGLE